MWVQEIRIKNVKGFARAHLEFCKTINVIVGANNSGKSTILRSIQLLQPTGATQTFFKSSIRAGESQREVEIRIAEPSKDRLKLPNWDLKGWDMRVKYEGRADGQSAATMTQPNHNWGALPGNQITFPQQPNNFIYPYFAQRKQRNFNITITRDNGCQVGETFEHLPSKIDKILEDSDAPIYKRFRKACHDILGIKISCTQHGQGKHVGLALEDGSLLAIDEMGEGVIHVLAFLVHLCGAKGKAFLIEEIENDLHPKALKALLEFIIESSTENQFIVTTHNNIVLRHLGGAAGSRVFAVSMTVPSESRIPTCSCKMVSDAPDDRVELLESLGYDVFDSFLWKGYLILEESTAERLIRDVIIPFFFPRLTTALRTISARTVSNVVPCFSDFHRLFVFVHTSPVYHERAWVFVDSGEVGTRVISELRERFGTHWPEAHFKNFPADQFEKFYPRQFEQDVANVLAMVHGLSKQRAKGELIERVVHWCLQNDAAAKEQLRISAADVISMVGEIDAKLHGSGA